MPIGVSYRAMLAAAGVDAGAVFSYAVGGNDPDTVADFSGVGGSGEYYRVGGIDSDFDSMFTYTGASNKTMIDSDGNLKWAPHNLITNSDDSGASAFGSSSLTTGQSDPDGGTNAVLVTAGDTSFEAVSFANVTPVADVNYTMAFWAKAGTTNWISARAAGTAATQTYFDLANITTGTVGAISATIVDAGDSWRFCTLTFTTAAPGTPSYIYVVTGDGALSCSIGDSATIYGPHVYRSDLGGMVDNPDRGDSYVPTTSSAVYLPRRNSYRYNGTSYVNKGITVESEARTNSCTQSSDLTTTWAIANTDSITRTSNQGTGPDGNTSLDELAITDTTNEHHDTNFTFTGTAANWTGSVYVDDVDQQYVGLRFYTSANEWAVAVFNLTAGTVTQESDGSGTTAIVGGEIELVASGLYRISLTATLTAASTIFAIQTHSGATPALTSTDGTEAYAGAGTESFYAGFVNIELGSTPSSYIPTSGATATRSAETLTIAAANMAYSATAMSFHAQGEYSWDDNDSNTSTSATNAGHIIWSMITNANDYLWLINDTGASGGSGAYRVLREPVLKSVQQPSGSLTEGINDPFNLAVRITASDLNLAVDGTALTADTSSSTMPSSADFKLGPTDAGTGGDFFGTFALFRQWDVDLGDTGIESATS